MWQLNLKIILIFFSKKSLLYIMKICLFSLKICVAKSEYFKWAKNLSQKFFLHHAKLAVTWIIPGYCRIFVDHCIFEISNKHLHIIFFQFYCFLSTVSHPSPLDFDKCMGMRPGIGIWLNWAVSRCENLNLIILTKYC